MSRRKNKTKRNSTNNNGVSYSNLKDTGRIYKAAKLSIIIPLVFSVLFWGMELLGVLRYTPGRLNFYLALSKLISYVVPTILSSATFMLVQQFFLLIPAGLSNEKGWVLLLAAIIFAVIYGSYLSSQQEPREQYCILFLCAVFFIILWSVLNLNSVVVNKDQPFSG